MLCGETVLVIGLPQVDFTRRVSPRLAERRARFVRTFNDLQCLVYEHFYSRSLAATT
ncbi:MAG TPA: hypothetical protein VGC79_02640 [Polyangiaceae bacterium]